MTHVITNLCLRDSGCVEVCPVECITPGSTPDWPTFYIDPETCIDCGACVPECPYNAIFPEDDVPTAFKANGGEYINALGLNGSYSGTDHDGNAVSLNTTRQLEAGETIDLTSSIKDNQDYYSEGPGYN